MHISRVRFKPYNSCRRIFSDSIKTLVFPPVLSGLLLMAHSSHIATRSDRCIELLYLKPEWSFRVVWSRLKAL